MTALNMHAISAPMYLVLLRNLATWLDKAEAHATQKKFDIEVLLHARLRPDMYSLREQIWFATAFAKNSQCRLAGQTPPDYPETDVTLDQLRARIARTIDIVQSIGPDALAGAEARSVTYGVGPRLKMTQTGLDYLITFCLPNFYFHMVTAYDILRHSGVELGKMDFLAGAFELPAAAE